MLVSALLTGGWKWRITIAIIRSDTLERKLYISSLIKCESVPDFSFIVEFEGG